MGKHVCIFLFASFLTLPKRSTPDFSVHVVSDAFAGKVSCQLYTSMYSYSMSHCQPTIQRHRMIYNLLSEEMDEGLHALSLKTKTIQESAS